MTSTATRPIDEPVRAALATATIAGRVVTIPGQMDRQDFLPVSRALQALGGRWTRGAGFRFDHDPAPLLATAVATGAVPAPDRIAEGFVRTPDELAWTLVDRYANLVGSRPGLRVLEPSAGDGAIVTAILTAAPAATVTAVEPNEQRSAGIPRGEQTTILTTTLEDYAGQTGGGQLDLLATPAAAARHELVVMNPPFSVPGQPDLWAAHLLTAWDLLEVGGRLVSIVPEGFAYRPGRRYEQVRALIDTHGGHDKLPAGMFAASGTGVGTMVVWADRTTPGYVPYLRRTYIGTETPVRVELPQLGFGAPPVQVWGGSWGGEGDRILRYRGRCVVCPRGTWAFDDGDNDVRGALGRHTAAYLSAWEYAPGMTGPDITFCAGCGYYEGGREEYEKALTIARTHWTPKGTP